MLEPQLVWTREAAFERIPHLSHRATGQFCAILRGANFSRRRTNEDVPLRAFVAGVGELPDGRAGPGRRLELSKPEPIQDRKEGGVALRSRHARLVARGNGGSADLGLQA